MEIKTKTFNVTPAQLKQLIAVNYYKQRRNLLILFAVLALINIVLAFMRNRWDIWAIYFLAFLGYSLVAPFLINLKKVSPAVNFINRYWEMDENFISIYYEDGSMSKMKYEHFIKVVKNSEYYFLYITAAGQFHYLPVAAFHSEKDIHRFDLFLEGKQLIKLW